MKKLQIFILGILAAMFFISCNNAAASSGNEKKQKYSIEYVLNGGAWAADYEAPAEYTEGKEVKLPDASKLTRTAYTFAGWYETTTFTGSPVTTLTKEAKGNKKFYAKWSAISYTITLASTIEGGTVTSDKTSAAAGETVTLTAAAAAGYEFKAWLVKDSTGTAVTVTNNTFSMPASNVIVENPFALEQKYSIIVKEGEEVISELFYEYTLTKHFQVEIFSESRVKAGTTVYAWVLAQAPLLGVKADVISEGAVINPDMTANYGGNKFSYDYEEYKYPSVLITFEMPSNDVTIDLSCAPIYKSLNEIKDSEPYYDYVTFGEWPQTKLTDTTVTVDESDSKEAGQFTYYKGSDNAWYAKLSSDYFKVEPIKWYNIPEYYITGTDGSKRFLVSANILLYGYYYDGEQQSNRYRNGPDPNNYEHSRIRALLNGISYNKECTDCDTYLNKGFLFGAFSQAERDLIATTSVVTENPDSTTQDKIFLLSKQELTKCNEWLQYYDYIDAEKKTPVDYAYYQMSQSTKYEKDGYWWLRSPYEEDDFSAYAVTSSGESEEVYGVRQYPLGIVPVLCLE